MYKINGSERIKVSAKNPATAHTRDRSLQTKTMNNKYNGE